jgi:DNA polymerase III alpha subunit
MVFFTIEDETGLINLVFSPDAYQRNDTVLGSAAFVCVTGTLESRGGALSVKVELAHAPRTVRRAVIRPIAPVSGLLPPAP